MITIIYGEDRVKAGKEAERILGAGHEIFEGEELKFNDLPSLLLGASLFTEKRRILVKNLAENKELYEKLPEFLEKNPKIEPELVVWEQKIDKRSVFYKKMNQLGMKCLEFKLVEKVDKYLGLNVFDVALRDGPRAVKMLEPLEVDPDGAYVLVGAFAWKAIENYRKKVEERGVKAAEKEKRVLKELSKLDIQMKTTPFLPWTLVKTFLLRVSSL